ncbi:MAG: lipoyl(octanoyl) transferase [Marine Group III euryarchaeote CG-Epi2]|uniref:Octanoyltransferase n=1 Tax=Marine Group III euryarchaeote CG-Epi2 TaxID=1888996 RepID=A0A1J5TKQ3_9ARCH|nr:MAG: lipoyl(octanoyl) transferase [Marine Group III euryarchaeote CG-Epi2]
MILTDIIQAGNSSHDEIDQLMVKLQEKRIKDEIRDTLIFVEHPEIVTVGRRGMLDNIKAPEGFASSDVDRGGGLTWHGPGQLVCYPIFKWKEESVRTVITKIEDWIISSLLLVNITGVRNDAMQGVWFNGYKIASIGLAFSKWVSRHGFDINLNTPDNRIESVEGCGLPIGKHTSLSKFGYEISIQEMQKLLIKTMPAILNREVANLENL